MKFFELIDELRAGKKIWRKGWDEAHPFQIDFISIADLATTTIYQYKGAWAQTWVAFLDDFEYDDWEVVKVE